MQADPLYVFGTVLSLLLFQEDYVLEALMPETHFFSFVRWRFLHMSFRAS